MPQYTYFTASALGIKVPQGLKRTLTSLQIAQFVFGASYAAAHLFVAYDIPIQTPYQVASAFERAASTASSAASHVTSSVSEFVETPTVTASLGSLVKKLLLRAAGEEGVAERVAMSKPGVSAYAPSVPRIEEKMEKIWERRFETHYRSEWSRVNCIDTTGEAFAIYLNLLYLAPLTWLFGRFFVRAYTARGKGGRPRSASAAAQVAADVVKEARKGTEESFEKGGMQAEDELMRRGSQGKEKGEELYDQLRKDVKSMKDGTWRDRRVSERVQSYEGKVKSAAEKAKESVKSMTNGSRSPSKSGSDSKGGDSAIVDDAPAAASAAIDEKEDKAAQEKQSEGLFTSGAEKSDNAAEQASSESAEKQEETLAESEPIRPAPEDSAQDDQSTNDPEASESTPHTSGEDKTYSEVVSGGTGSTDGGEAKEPEAEGKADSPSTPQVAGEKTEDDSDAMGRSGVGIESSDASSPSSTAGNDPETKAAES